jgi:uncharacterized protein (DUF427 family)
MSDHSIKPGGQRMKAVWRGTTIATSDSTKIVEGNFYFPAQDVERGHLEPSSQTSVCPWKGNASYYDIVVDGERNAAAAWYYPQPMEEATEIKDYVAFWRGVEVVPA